MNTFEVLPFDGTHKSYNIYHTDNQIIGMEEGIIKKIETVPGGLYGEFDWSYKSVSMLKEVSCMSIITNREKKSTRVGFSDSTKKYDGKSYAFELVDEILKGYRLGMYLSAADLIDMEFTYGELRQIYDVFEDVYVRIHRTKKRVPMTLCGALSYKMDYRYIPSIRYILHMIRTAAMYV